MKKEVIQKARLPSTLFLFWLICVFRISGRSMLRRIADQHGGKGCHGDDIRKQDRYHQGGGNNIGGAAEPEFFLCLLFTQYPVEQSAVSFGKQRPFLVVAVFDEADGEKKEREQKDVQNGWKNTDENHHPERTQMDGFAENFIQI